MALRVLRGCDNTTDARSMYEVVKPKTTIKLYVIKHEAFVKAKSPDNYGGSITSIMPGTMRVHHITTDTQGKIAYRNVSCCCASGKMCDCYDLKHIFPVCTVRVADSPALTEVELPGGNKSLIDE